ncbi:universal stress protein [Pseudonocardia xinjiangensis]|uniref:universal stress protein n=1 Tax=Pseudonocardia xinjiangensis TaxID=75289 RepID=UPI003D8A8373
MTRFELGCDGPMTLVVGVDGSDTGWRAFHYALGQARRQGARVVAVFAESFPAATFAGTGALALPMAESSADELRDELRGAVEALAAEHGVQVRFVVAAADPVLALTQVAEEVRADAILVGASTQAAHRLFGSVAVRAVRAGRWPVTVVP